MQIQKLPKSISSLGKTWVRIFLEETGVERFTITDGVQELHLVTPQFKKVTPRTYQSLIRGIVSALKRYKIENAAIDVSSFAFPKLNIYDETWKASFLSQNLLIANYEYSKYKSKPKKETLQKLALCGDMTSAFKKGIDEGIILAEAVNFCRDISNTPGGDMTPKLLSLEAKNASKGTKIATTVIDKRGIEKLGMGGLLKVGEGSQDEPKFIIMEYWGAGKPTKSSNDPEKQPVVFVGKGITFDTGGLQIKPGMSMYEMHLDMSGGASVIATLRAVAKLGIKKNVIGLIPSAENAVGERSMRPGDVITMMSGKTVDILHTDAEGRLVLADALHYARRYNPKLVVDIATLTGASLVALGQHANAIMTKSRKLERIFRDLGEKSGDYVFPLPLWNEYAQYTNGVHGDIANIPANDSKYGGAILGGMFLAHFTRGMKWVHIDMAPRMTSAPGDKLARGATGEPTRLLVEITKNF